MNHVAKIDTHLTDEDFLGERPLRHTDIHAVLRRELTSGVYTVGGRFPGDAELQARFGVGRHTIREALKALADEGYIERRRRSGTFVLAAAPDARYVQSLGNLHSLLDFSFDTRLEVRSFRHVELRDPQLCDWLSLPSGERWLRINGVRIHRRTELPVCWSEFFLPPAYSIDATHLNDLKGPIHELVARLYGFDINHVDQQIGAVALPVRVARPLQVTAKSPALAVVRRYHRKQSPEKHEGLDSLTQATLNLFPAGRYWVRSKIERDR